MKNRVQELFDIDFPLIQAGMIWCSGWRLASAVSNYGALGIIGSGSMYPDVLREHIQKCKEHTTRSFAVNVPLLYPDIDKLMQIIVDEGVKYVFTSAGNPKTWTKKLQDEGIKITHVVSSVKFALKAQEAGVDAVVAEGFEAGGHNGRDETTTMCLVPMVAREVDVPLIAAGGIGTGRAMLAAMILGAEAVQIGSRFVVSEESSGHENFKNRIVHAKEGDTMLALKKLTPVRMIKNEFYNQVFEAEKNGADEKTLSELLGRARAKKGMFEGNLEEGELEIGQISGMLDDIKPAKQIIEEIMNEYHLAKSEIQSNSKYRD